MFYYYVLLCFILFIHTIITFSFISVKIYFFKHLFPHNIKLQDLSAHTRVTPQQRQNALRSFSEAIHSNPEANKLLINWGLELDSDTAQVSVYQFYSSLLRSTVCCVCSCCKIKCLSQSCILIFHMFSCQAVSFPQKIFIFKMAVCEEMNKQTGVKI